MICEKCNKDVQVGDFPFCPHERRVSAVIGDDIPGGMTVENGFDEPTTFYSHSAHRAALAARGMEIRAKWAGPNDKHLKRWDVPCAATLESAKMLLSRKKSDPFVTEPEAPIPIEVTTITFERES